jgi:pimeloyl-ACP methyl ester carboxylesterase
MNPFYFGYSKGPLFGIYHPPTSRVVRDTGVLLCYPIGHEYMRAHWAFRRLAGILSRSGFHVLRFDYFGTGDSSGEYIEANISQWKNDVGTAVRELVDMSGVKAVSMVGVRLGATLAAQATIERIRFKDLVLWDPVVIGRDYIGELRTLHQNLFSGADGGPEKEGFAELVGYSFSVELVSEIEKINLFEQPHCKVEKVFIVVSEARREYLKLAHGLRGRGTDLEYRFVPDSTNWANLEDFDQVLLLNDIIHEIVAVIAGK